MIPVMQLSGLLIIILTNKTQTFLTCRIPVIIDNIKLKKCLGLDTNITLSSTFEENVGEEAE